MREIARKIYLKYINNNLLHTNITKNMIEIRCTDKEKNCDFPVDVKLLQL